MKFFGWIVFFLTIDLGSKFLAVYIPSPVLLYNKGMVGGADFGDFVNLYAPLILFPALLYLIKKEKLTENTILISLLCAGAIGNYAQRWTSAGVVDFIPIPFIGMVCNLADIYINVFVLSVVLNAYLQDKKQKHIEKTLALS